MKPSDIISIEGRAGEWLIRREAGFSASEQAEFDAWMEADPRHFAVFADLDATMALLETPRQNGEADQVVREIAAWEATPAAPRRNPWRTLAALGGLAAALALGAFVYRFASHRAADAQSEATMRPQPAQQHLADGSVVELNAGADIAVDFSSERRAVRLVQGEAHFVVAGDPLRPFVVTAGKVEVRAVGTAFAVRFNPDLVDVLVTEGKVAVVRVEPSSSSTPPAPVFVPAGQRLAVSAAAPANAQPPAQTASPAEIKEALAWREMRFEFTNTPLRQAVELFNQKSRVKLVVEDPSLSELRVSGIYWADNPEGFARLIESSTDIAFHRDADGRIVLHPRR